jgi:hypothetical protein
MTLLSLTLLDSLFITTLHFQRPRSKRGRLAAGTHTHTQADNSYVSKIICFGLE